jgi:decaprenyl-phosphate phosphoribosyltransferase
MLKTVMQTIRPRQWVKNLLLFLGPFAGGISEDQILKLLIGVSGFTFASIIGYVINDWFDKDFDKLHDSKKVRGFASGKLKFKHLFYIIGVCSIGIFLSSILISASYAFCIVFYLFLTICYSVWIKNIPVIELIILSSGFLLRGITGTVIVEIQPSGWFILSIFFGALFVVSGKRLSEKGKNYDYQTRKVLKEYSLEFLMHLCSISLTATLLTYSLWVLEVHPFSKILQITIIFVALILFRVLWHISKRNIEEPERIIYSDRLILTSLIATISFYSYINYIL